MRPQNLNLYRPDIDGLRAIAVLSVFAYHLNNEWLPGGYVGVDIFFVISGFLITKIIHTQIQNKEFSFLDFYGRRIRRIFPALFAMLGIMSFLVWFTLPHGQYHQYFIDLKYAAAQLSNLHFLRTTDYMNLDARPSVLLHTWSLGVEEQFYLIWPFALLAIAKFKDNLSKWCITIFIVSLAMCQVIIASNDFSYSLTFQGRGVFELNNSLGFYFPLFRAYEFMLGTMLVVVQPVRSEKYKHVLSFLGFALILYSCFMFDNETVFPGLYALIPAFGTALCIYAGKRGLINTLISNKFMVFIGLISYSLYLWHWPLIVITQSVVGEHFTLITSFMVFVITCLISYLSWRFVEKPFRATPNCYMPSIFLGGFVVVTFIVFSIFMIKNANNLGRKLDPSIFNEAFTLNQFEHPDCLSYSYEENRISNKENASDVIDCAMPTSPQVLLLGDSHGVSTSYLIKQWAKDNNLTSLTLSSYGCPPYVADFTIRHTDICSRMLSETYDRIIQTKRQPLILFISTRYDGYLTNAGKNKYSLMYGDDKDITSIEITRLLMRDTLEKLSKLGNTQVVVFSQAPRLKEDPQVCLSKQHVVPMYKWFLGGEDCSADVNELNTVMVNELAEHHMFIEGLASEYKNVHFFDITDAITSIYNENGDVLYFDDDHLNMNGALSLMPELTEFMKQL